MPERQPDYRKKRSHLDFVTSLDTPAGKIKEALIKTWAAAGELKNVPLAETSRLAESPYSRKEWIYKF